MCVDGVAADSCKFLHDRSDYKSGWQLDREFEENQGRGEGEACKRVPLLVFTFFIFYFFPCFRKTWDNMRSAAATMICRLPVTYVGRPSEILSSQSKTDPAQDGRSDHTFLEGRYIALFAYHLFPSSQPNTS